MVQSWAVWRTEYLHTLTFRHKCSRNTRWPPLICLVTESNIMVNIFCLKSLQTPNILILDPDPSKNSNAVLAAAGQDFVFEISSNPKYLPLAWNTVHRQSHFTVSKLLMFINSFSKFPSGGLIFVTNYFQIRISPLWTTSSFHCNRHLPRHDHLQHDDDDDVRHY